MVDYAAWNFGISGALWRLCERNISRAAKRLGISQPTLSKQPGELEDELEQPPLTRGAHSLKLTAKGA